MAARFVIVCLPKPQDPPMCYLSHFCAEVHEEKEDKLLIDFPLGLFRDATEKRWIPTEWTLPL